MTFIDQDEAPLAPVPADTGFARSLAGRTEAVLDVSAPKPSTGLADFGPGDFDEKDAEGQDISVFDSLGAAFADNGIVTGLARGALNSQEFPDNPDYRLDQHLSKRPDDLATIQPFLDDFTDPNATSVLQLLESSRSAGQTEAIIKNLRDSQERMRIAKANGLAVEILGMVGGIGLDVAASLGITAATGGAGAGALLGTATRATGAAQRGLAAGRLAALGAAEGAGERGAQSLTNPLISGQNILEAAGFGAAAGAALGVAFPAMFGNVKKIADEIQNPAYIKPGNPDAIIDDAMAATGRGGDLSAARTPGTEPARTAVPGRGSGTTFARRIPRTLQENVFRNPKRVGTDIGVQGNKDFEATGAKGGRDFFDVFRRVVRLSTASADEIGGGLDVGRMETITDVRDRFRATRLARQQQSDVDYRTMMKDVFGAGVVSRILRNSEIVTAIPGARRIHRDLLSQEQFEAMADEFSIAEAGQFAVEVIPQEVLKDLTIEQQNALRRSIKATAKGEDEYYQKFGQLEVEMGLIKEEELIPGYRPQRWNRESITQDPRGFQQFLLEAFEKEPDEAWVRETYLIREASEDSDALVPAMKDDETFAQFAAREPEMADEILDDWSAGLRNEAQSKALEVEDVRKAELKRVRGDVITTVSTRLDNQEAQAGTILRSHNRRLDALNEQIGRSTGSERAELQSTRAKLDLRIAKAEKRLDDLQQSRAALRTATRTAEEIDQFIRKHGNIAQKQKLRKATGAVTKAGRKEAQIGARKLISEQISGIRTAIINGESPFQFIDDGFVNSSSRFKRRNINLREHRFTPNARRFLLTNAHDNRVSFDGSVGAQLSMRKVFGSNPGEEGETLVDGIIGQALRGYDEDLRKATDPKQRAKLSKDRTRAQDMLTGIFQEFTGGDIANIRTFRGKALQGTRLINTATAASSLGGVTIASLGDIAVQMMAGGKLGTGFRLAWRGGQVKKHLREISQSEPELAVILQGMGTIDMGRFRAFAELDQAEINVPGGKFGRVMRIVDEVAVLEGWANLLNVFSGYVRGGFGLDFARQVSQDIGKYDSLAPSLKTFYAKVGIDGKTAKEMHELLQASNRKHVNGHLILPDSDVWAKKRPDLLEKYQTAMNAAGNEAMIEPGVGDRPFLRSSAAGKLILQFQSFMFTAGERFIAPMVQEFQMHPTSIRPYMAALAGVYMGIMVDGLKHGARGELDQWSDNWSSPEGIRDNLWAGVLRSPMMAGPSSTLTDLALTNFGRVANDRSEDVLGARPFREESSRFRESQGFGALFGPAAGLATGTLPSIARRAMDGDVEDATLQLARRIPVLNVFYLQLLAQLATRE